MQKTYIYRRNILQDLFFILWAGGAALLSYSLVYALRKPFTAAVFDGLEVWGMDFKVILTITQIVGYLLAKFCGIKLISELKSTQRLKFILSAVVLAELALIGFAVLPLPLNVLSMFFNGLALGCMWGVIFSFIEGRRMTDLLASLLGISMVISWIFAQLDGMVTMIILVVFGLLILIRNNRKALLLLLGMVICSMMCMSYLSFCYDSLQWNPETWLFFQSLCLYMAYLCFQTIFFDRFIACFRIQGNVGFFIVLIDFVGYLGTVIVLIIKEFFNPDIDWSVFYNRLAGYVGMSCVILFLGAFIYLCQVRSGRKIVQKKEGWLGPLPSSTAGL